MGKTNTYSQQRRSKVGAEVVVEPRRGQQLALEPVVRDQLRSGHQDSTVHIGSQAAHQLGGSLLLDNPEEAVKSVFVVALLLLGELAVVHHPDVDDVCWVAESATNASCEHTAHQHGADWDTTYCCFLKR